MAAKEKPKPKPRLEPRKKHAGGRPTIFTAAMANEICERIARGESLRHICESDHMPWRETVMHWLLDENKNEFYLQYTKARNVALDVMAEEIIEIADTPQVGEKEKSTANGLEVTRGDMIEHRRLRVDARKWYLSKLAPKKYGDKVNLEHTGPDGGAVKVDISDTERARRIAFAIQRGLNAAKQGGE